jgi:hypothetical protein
MYPPKRKRSRIVLLFLVPVLVLAFPPGVPKTWAGTCTAILKASVRVLPYLKFNLLSQVSELTITEEDVKRGYLDVRSGSRLEVKTNSTNGYMMVFDGNPSPFKEVQILGLANPVFLISGHGMVYQPSSRGKVFMDLGYRFILSQNTQPGSYPWPLSLSVHPI